jgi:DNA repair exonuclease SbcCD ATPase subunit
MTTASENTAGTNSAEHDGRADHAQNTEQNTGAFIITTFKSAGGIDVVKGFLEQEYSKYSTETAAEVPQIDTAEGRKRIKDLAASINKKLSELDTPIRDYLRDIKEQPKLIEKIAKENKDKFTQLRADILKPLEDAQAWQDEKLNWLNGIPAWCATNPAAADLSALLVNVEAFTLDDIWSELLKKFKVAHECAVTTLKVTLERIELAEAQAAELEELRRKQALAEQQERDRKIAEEAAAKARADADAQAKKDREDLERRAVEAKQREENAKASEQKAIRDAELAEEKRKQDAIESEARSVAAAKESAERQALAVKKAAEDEAKRIADEEAEQQRLAQAREANKEHRIKINRAAMVDLIAAGLTEELARAAITAIAKKQVRNISIQY